MANFDEAFNFILPNEGLLVDNENDEGGLTHYGISFRFLKNLPIEKLRSYGIWEDVKKETIIDMTLDQAKKIYLGEFWSAAPFDKIENQGIANYVFDMAINMGVAQAIKILQRAIWAALSNYNYVVDDGVMGEKTLKAVQEAGDLLRHTLPSERAGYYRLLVDKFPKNKEFLHGWLTRCYRI